MPKGKKSTASKTAEPVKEKAAEPEKKAVKAAADKKKATAPKKAAAKSSAKKVSTSATTKAANKVTETKKAASKTTKKPTVKTSATSTAKKTASNDSKKPVAKNAAKGKSDEVLIQSGGKDYTLAEIIELCKNDYRGGTRKQVKSIKVWVKAEKNKLVANYVVNDSVNGAVDL